MYDDDEPQYRNTLRKSTEFGDEEDLADLNALLIGAVAVFLGVIVAVVAFLV